jgi:hypothetical protein
MTGLNTSRARTVTALLATALGAGLIGALGTSVIARPSDVVAIGTVRQVMHALDPSADAIWAAVSTDVTAAGVIEMAPSTEEEWQALEAHAVMLAEAGNLLLLPGRRVDEAEWVTRARQLREAGKAALAAVKSRNTDEVLQVGEQVTTSCDACHRTYWDPSRVLLH